MTALLTVLALLAVTPAIAAAARWQMRRDARAWQRWLLQRRLERLQADCEAFARQLGEALLPAVKKMAAAMNSIISSPAFAPIRKAAAALEEDQR